VEFRVALDKLKVILNYRKTKGFLWLAMLVGHILVTVEKRKAPEISRAFLFVTLLLRSKLTPIYPIKVFHL
jgi:hypothetical protein